VFIFLKRLEKVGINFIRVALLLNLKQVALKALMAILATSGNFRDSHPLMNFMSLNLFFSLPFLNRLFKFYIISLKRASRYISVKFKNRLYFITFFLLKRIQYTPIFLLKCQNNEVLFSSFKDPVHNLSASNKGEPYEDEFYKSYYEWLAGVIDVRGILKFESNHKNMPKKLILDIELNKPFYYVLTAVWLHFGGSIKQLSNLEIIRLNDFEDPKILYKYDYRPINKNRAHFLNESGLPLLFLDGDYPFQTWRYRLKEHEKIKKIIKNTYLLFRREYVINILYRQKLIKISKAGPKEDLNSSHDLAKGYERDSSLIFNNSNLDFNSQWFAGVFDACGIISNRYFYLAIMLHNVCEKLLRRIRVDFDNIGTIRSIGNYTRHGMDEERADWIIDKPEEMIFFASYVLRNCKLVSGKEHKLKLVEKHCTISKKFYMYQTTEELIKLEEEMEKFMNNEWNNIYTNL
jgi:hypothetical protein